MLRLISLSALASISLQGCPFLQPQTTVELVNDSQSQIEVQLFIDDDQLIAEEVLEETNPEVDLVLDPGEVYSYSRNCEEIQAVLVHGDARIIGGIGPSSRTNVLRDGDDFGCGSLLEFSFRVEDLGTSLEIDFSRRN